MEQRLQAIQDRIDEIQSQKNKSNAEKIREEIMEYIEKEFEANNNFKNLHERA